MRIKLTKDLTNGQETCSSGEEFDAILVSPRSTTVEFSLNCGKKMRAFSYEYETLDATAETD